MRAWKSKVPSVVLIEEAGHMFSPASVTVTQVIIEVRLCPPPLYWHCVRCTDLPVP